MTYFSAIMPIADGMGLAFAITSYDGQLIISPTSCRELMPDPEFFAQCLRESFQEALEAALRVPEPPALRRAAAKARGASRAAKAPAAPRRKHAAAKPRRAVKSAPLRASPGGKASPKPLRD